MSAPTGKKLDVKVLRFLVFTSRARLIPLTQVALDIVCRVAPPRLAVQNRRARFANSRRRLLTKRAALGSYSNGAGRGPAVSSGLAVASVARQGGKTAIVMRSDPDSAATTYRRT